nr:hypothetical protein [uncultured Shinella sp.]
MTGSVDAAIRGGKPMFVGGEDADVEGAAVSEAMVCAKNAGLEPEVWWEVMRGVAADSFVLQHDVPRSSPATMTRLSPEALPERPWANQGPDG